MWKPRPMPQGDGVRFFPTGFILQVAFEERWKVEDRARAKVLIRRLERSGVEELHLIPPDGLEARVSGRRPVLSPVVPDAPKPILEGLEALAFRFASRST
jgi:hypothetical protein